MSGDLLAKEPADKALEEIASDPAKGPAKEVERLTGLFKEAVYISAVKYSDLLNEEKIKFAEKAKR